MNKISLYIDEKRKVAGISRRQMARMMGISYDTYCRRLKDKFGFSESQMVEGASALGFKLVLIGKTEG